MNGDELILRIVPELDPEATEKVKKEFDDIPTKMPLGKRGKSAEKSESDALNQSIRTRIDLIDLESRKTQAQSLDRVKQLQIQAAQGKITQGELVAGLEREEQARNKTIQSALRDYAIVDKQIQQTTILTEKQSVALERKLLFATERAKGGLVSVSRSMEGFTSNTKSANIAFANFGRIVQDAPFGLLGISNNIDPLLNSFRELKQETGGTGLALRAMGRQLLGPAGLIFLLGSALPTALLFLQEHLRKTKKEADGMSDSLGDALKRFTEQISDINSEGGVEQISESIRKTQVAYDSAIARQKVYNDQIVSATSAIQTADDEERKRLNATIQRAITNRNRTTEEIKLYGELKKALQENLVIAEQEERLQKAAGLAGLEIERDKNGAIKATNDELERRLALLDEEFFRLRRGRPTQEFEVSELRKRVQATANVLREGERLLTREEIDEARNRAIQVSDSALEVTRAGLATKLQLYRTSEQQVGEVMSAGAMFRAQLLENEQQGLIEMMDLSVSLARTAFGNTKGVAIAEALVNTYVGVSRAFREYTPPLSGVIAGLQLANGLAQVNKIRNTKIGDKGGSASTSSASASPSPSLPFVNDLGLAGQVAGTITPFGASMSPSISITANLDRQGLALAVRDGEADIATRQIPFAS